MTVLRQEIVAKPRLLFRPHAVLGWSLTPGYQVQVRFRPDVIQIIGADGWRHVVGANDQQGPNLAVGLVRRNRLEQPEVIVTDKLRSYAAALKEVGAGARQDTGRWLNNRAENSHLPFRRRERAMLRFRRMRSLQKFASVHASVSNHFNQDRSLSSRPHFKLNRTAALDEWRGLCAG